MFIVLLRQSARKLSRNQEINFNLLLQASQVAERFKLAFNLFIKCHIAYNGGVMDEAVIDQLGELLQQDF